MVRLLFVSRHSIGLVGVLVMICSIPLNAYVARLQTNLQKRQMKNKDQRTRIMSEIMNNIRTIKLSCWENSFAQRVSILLKRDRQTLKT